jgi:hypothetical protein
MILINTAADISADTSIVQFSLNPKIHLLKLSSFDGDELKLANLFGCVKKLLKWILLT